jgi:DNA repair photolyase
MAELDTETAAEVAIIRARISQLKAMRASGVTTAVHMGTTIQYRTMSELSAAIRAEQSDLRKLLGVTRRPAYILQSTKGY